ncbi:MAG: cupin domain-containing protein [Acidiferrobacterales bacterium]
MSARPKAISTIQIDNDRVIVTEWRFAPGAETGWHRHEYDYIVVPLTTGRLLLETKDGVGSAKLGAGGSYFRKVGVEHNVRINRGN